MEMEMKLEVEMVSSARPTIVFVIGCTGSGKARLAAELARRFRAEILSVDSMKVYRQMDIGTAKPSAAMRKELKFHLIDVVDPSEPFSAATFVELAEHAIADIHRRAKLIIGSGGTAMYLKALTEGLFEAPASDPAIREELTAQALAQGSQFLHHKLQQIDPEAAERIHPNDLKRIVRAMEVHQLTGRRISELQKQFGQLREDYNMLFIGLRHERSLLNRRINARVRKMIELGLVDEVQGLYHRDPPLADQARQALGYAEIIRHIEGDYDLKTAVERIKINTRRFAKSQRTWFRQMRQIEWFDVPEDKEPLDLIDAISKQITAWLETQRR